MRTTAAAVAGACAAAGGGRASSSPAPSRAIASPAGRRLLSAADSLPPQLPLGGSPGTGAAGSCCPESAAAAAAAKGPRVPRLLRPLVLICDLDDTLVGGELDRGGGSGGDAAEGDEAPSAARARWPSQLCDAHSAQLAVALTTWRQRWRQQAQGQGQAQAQQGGGAGGAGPVGEEHPPCWFVVNTGRTLPLFVAAQRERCGLLAQPDVLLCGVGTRMYTPAPLAATAAGPPPAAAAACPEGSWPSGQCDWRWAEHAAWAEYVAGAGGGSASSSDDGAAEEGCGGAAGADWHIDRVAAAVQEVMQRLGPDSLGWRGAEENESLKLTVTLAAARLAACLDALDAALAARRVRYRLVVGPRDEPGPGWAYADILPVRAGKLAAATYAAQWLLRTTRPAACDDCSGGSSSSSSGGGGGGRSPPPSVPPGLDGALGLEAVVVAGDAPNDLDMLAGSPHASIAVGNCHPTVRRFAASAMAVTAAAAGGPAPAGPSAPGSQADGLGSLEARLQPPPLPPPLQAGWDAGAAAVAGVAMAIELGPQAEMAMRLLLERWEDRHGDVKRTSGDRGGSESSSLSLSSLNDISGGDSGVSGVSGVSGGSGGSGGSPLRPPRVHLANLPAAGGVMEGLRAMGYME
ncbi:hypothetical protein HXX76_008036 [Chlamydomonas incerta]|uniref:Sucrose phosphatase-like domain-containing protein n=1 Tax=Chlamydomonas incerta TaxID=51695 RepID=A0A835T736_CHLIN|nr:hypothetical protein HXX76_008036 [Chlamydomonas incerta]|eukprot:KAG2433665.1 hypothetical protein HXX76_008036 [Chlamydomonas incerta]